MRLSIKERELVLQSIYITREGEEVLTYTQGIGWHEKETKAETGVHSALKSAYYEAYHNARKLLKAGMGTAPENDSGICQSGFDMKA